jgi:hypothetical protein
MSAIIISIILLVVVVAGSTTGFTTRFNMLDGEAKQRSVATADACINMLMYWLSSGETIQGTVSGTYGTCTISNVSGSYKISAIVSHAQTNLLVTVDSTPAITLIQEVAN